MATTMEVAQRQATTAPSLTNQQDMSATVMESVLLMGDLSKLQPTDRVRYYKAVCDSLHLNPLTKPFDYINLNGKLTLYAKKDCTDQLRAIHGISITFPAREVIEGCYVVTARAMNPAGRGDESTGAVAIDGLKGEARANALMKAETKAKRRVTLSICGLGFPDESEIDSIPNARRVDVDDNGNIIDTGGHPMNTAEARDYVRDKKLAEIEKQKRDNSNPQMNNGGSSARHQVATEAASGETDARQSAGTTREIPPSSTLGPEVSGELQALYVRLGTSIKTILPTLAELKSDIVELAGTDKPYYQIINKHGWQHADKETVKACNKIEVVRQIARELFEYAQKCRESLEFQATDDDLPEALQPKQASLIEPEASYAND